VQVDYLYLALLGVILGSLFGMLYYSIRMLSSMKRGLLERSWRYLCWGAILAVFGIVIVGISTVAFPDGSSSYIILNTTGVIIDTVAVVFFFLGFRSHSAVFHPKEFVIPKKVEEPAPLDSSQSAS
jgi:hypothetical protein